MTPEQMKFAYDLVLGKVSYEEFVRGTGLDPVGQSDAIEPELRDADISYEEFVRRTGLDPVGQPGFIEQALRDALLSQDAPTLRGRFKSNYESLVTINRIIVIQINASLVSGKAS